jgi:undecaprenyl-diphosphatase
MANAGAFSQGSIVTAYLRYLLNLIGLHPNLAIAAAFIVSAGEALPVIGLFSPSTVVLIGIGGLVGLGKVSFWPAFIATILAPPSEMRFPTDRSIYKRRLVEIWPFPVITDSWRPGNDILPGAAA